MCEKKSWKNILGGPLEGKNMTFRVQIAQERTVDRYLESHIPRFTEKNYQNFEK